MLTCSTIGSSRSTDMTQAPVTVVLFCPTRKTENLAGSIAEMQHQVLQPLTWKFVDDQTDLLNLNWEGRTLLVCEYYEKVHEILRTFATLIQTIVWSPAGQVESRTAACLIAANARQVVHGTVDTLIQAICDQVAEMDDQVTDDTLDRMAVEHGLIGYHPKWRDVLRYIYWCAPSEHPVIVTGETGCGKELVATTLHKYSPRREKSFVAVNAHNIPDDKAMATSHLVGHSKGAYTGADRAHAGYFKMAEHGTLFLDEGQEMGMGVQASLLRIIEQRPAEILGGEEQVEFPDVRIVVGTAINLCQLVGEKKFRDDLYFRLNVLRIDLPPLRDRRSDIPLLINHFIKTLRDGLKSQCVGVSSSVGDLFLHYDWPGNVRELRNLLLAAMILYPKAVQIDLHHLPRDFLLGMSKRHTTNGDIDTVPHFTPALPESAPLISSNRQHEREMIKQALERNEFNRTRTARDLGICRVTLQKKIKRYGLQDYGLEPAK